MIDYLDWDSQLTLDHVFASGDTFSFPHFIGSASSTADSLLYLTSLKSEKSRSALILQTGNETECITPAPFNLRTSINEYGGRPFWVFGQEIVFANQKDQCLYRQTLSDGTASYPKQITRSSDSLTSMYTDVVKVSDDIYLALVEQERPQSQENVMCVVLLDVTKRDSDPIVLSHGADFYSNLVYHAGTKRIAWVQWNHPNMPWDETELWVAKLDLSEETKLSGVEARINARHKVPLASKACVCQLRFAGNGRLFFSADDCSGSMVRDYWNIYCLDVESSFVSEVTNLDCEFGYPHWVYGDLRIVQLTSNQLLAVGSRPQGDSLFAIDQDSLAVTTLTTTESTIQHLQSNGDGKFVAELLEKDRPPALVTASLTGEGTLSNFDGILTGDDPVEEVSLAEHMKFQCRDNGEAYGFFYPPKKAACELMTDAEQKPPLIVLIHGGPTARAYRHFDIQKQFWTSRGFALLDVNHRGSTGYGRAYRDALYGNWGELDTSDIMDGIEALVKNGKVDPERICIRGKSAGGYAVLRALTEYPNRFKAGACYYGIGNLVTLAETTHKFEKYYTDRLIGEEFSPQLARTEQSRFYQRSPIHKISQVNSAMIVFQGRLDKVVPPSVAEEVVDVLKTAELEHQYVEYDDEGHGFRMVDNNIDAWSKELAFYRKVLGKSS